MDRDRPVVHLRVPGLAGRRGGGGVPGRLPDREEPVDRQRVRVGADPQLLRRAPGVPTPRPLLGHLRRAGAPGRLHLRRGRPAQPVLLADLRVRRLPARHRGAVAVPRRRGGPSGEQPRPQARAPRHPVDRGVRRPAPVHPPRRCAAGDPPVRRADRGGDQRRRLRRRLHPRDPGRDPQRVRGVHLERLRHPRPAGPLLPVGGPQGPLRVPPPGPGRRSSPSSA